MSPVLCKPKRRGSESSYVAFCTEKRIITESGCCMFFKWEICWAAGVSRSRAPLRNATRRGGRTRRATSRWLKMTAASQTQSARRRATGPPETRPRRYAEGFGGCACDDTEEGSGDMCATGTILTRPGHGKGNRVVL